MSLSSSVFGEVDDEFDIKGTELSDSELISRLDHNCEIIVNYIAGLVTKITRERTISTTLIDHVRKTINEVGQYLSLIEDIMLDISSDQDGLVADFLAKKSALYSVLNELVTVTMTGEDGFPSSNKLGHMLETSTQVLENVEIVLIAVKLLVDRKELLLEKSLYNSCNKGDESESGSRDDANLEILQKRAKSLSLVDVSEPQHSRGSRQSLNQEEGTATPRHLAPPSPRERRNRAPSGSELRVDPSFRKSYLTPQGYSNVRRGSQSSTGYPPHSGPISGESMSSSTKLAHFFGEGSLPINSARLSQDVCVFTFLF